MPEGLIKRPHNFTPSQILIATFLALITVGTLLLMLPLASLQENLGFIDALFTATSAVCVTGLTVVDTGTQFSSVGLIIILILIQLGGLGLMTFSTIFLLMVGKSPSVRTRLVLQDTLTHLPYKDLFSLVKSVLLFTFLIEGIGAFTLFLRWIREYTASQAMFMAVFHAISAFCNAGFSLFKDSFIRYQGDTFINLTIIFLISLGGIGFLVLNELYSKIKGYRRKALSLHTKLTLFTSLLLLVSGSLSFLFLEYYNALKGFPLGQKILTSLFQSVTARTAGFNTIDFGTLTNSTLLIWMLLMFVGASPGSCGGGVKTTTIAVFFASLRSRIKGREAVSCMHRTIPVFTVHRAVTIVTVGLLTLIFFIFLLLVSQPLGGVPVESRGLFLGYMFEAASAFGTVGLSLGATSHLTQWGKILIILLMFTGRLGPLTLVLSLKPREKIFAFQYSEENVMMG